LRDKEWSPKYKKRKGKEKSRETVSQIPVKHLMQDARVIQNELHFTATHSRVVAKKKERKKFIT